MRELWENTIPQDHSLTIQNLAVVEHSKPEGMDFKYLIVHKDDTLIGLIYLQHLTIIPSHFDGTQIDKPGLRWLKKSIQSQFSDVLICGNLFRIHFPGYYFIHNSDDVFLFEILLQYLSSDKVSKKYCGILVKDSPHQLTQFGKFKPYHDDVTMEIEIKSTWQSISDYKDCLRKKYKQRFTKIIKSKIPLTLKELTLEEIKENENKLEQLYLNVALKQSLRIGLISKHYFYEMKQCLDGNFSLIGYYKGDELIAFSSHIFYPNKTMEINFIGLNYTYNETYNLYFNILYDGLNLAIQTKSKRLELGRTARIAKASMGAEPVEIFNYIYLRSGIPSMTFSFFNSWFLKKIGEDWKNRQPFK